MQTLEMHVPDPFEPLALPEPTVSQEPAAVPRRRKIAAICVFALIPVAVLLAIAAVHLLAAFGASGAGGCGGG